MPSYTVKTFGCQMNMHDSERMHEVLRGAGYSEATEPESADVIVINTCSVREKAEQKLRSLVGTLAESKKRRPELVIAVAGCVAQQEGEQLLARMKQIDIVVGPDNIPELPSLVHHVITGGLPVARTVFDVDAPAFLRAEPAVRGGAAPTSFVTVMKGCNERCSFCIVPYTRGPERYRASHEIVEEVERLVAAGTREITLLGQTVNSYRDPRGLLPAGVDVDPLDPDESEFASLLRAIAAKVPELPRLRYTSPHPRHLTRSLISAHRDVPSLCAHVHMPVQSGSDRVLRRMIRRYSRAEYEHRARALLDARPGLTLTTDVIVGFPGETEEDFAQTIDLVHALQFKGLYGFKYSPRPKTPALKLPDDVPDSVKRERLAALFEVSEAILRKHLESLVGTQQTVLVEGASKSGSGKVTGRTFQNEIVHIEAHAPQSLIGQIVEVDIARAFKHSLEGVLREASTLMSAPNPSSAAQPVLHVAPSRKLPLFSPRQPS